MSQEGTHALLLRLRRGVGANGLMQFVQLLLRLGEAPLFILIIGAAGYGEWLLVSALPAAFSLGDGGFTRTINREMVMSAAKGDKRTLSRMFKTGWVMLLSLSAVFILILLLIVSFLPLGQWLNIESTDSSSVKIAFTLLAVQALVRFQCTLLYGAYASQKKYATGTLYSSLTYLFPFIGVACGLMVTKDIVGAAVGSLIGAVFAFIVMRLMLVKHHSDFSYGFDGLSLTESRRLLLPSLANMAFPIGEMINMQGTRLLIGILAGPAMLASFSTLRTLSRTALQPVLAVSRAMEAELSIAHGEGNTKRLKKLFVLGSHYAFWASLALAAILVLVGESAYNVWINGAIQFDNELFNILLMTAFLSSIWNVILVVPASANRHERIASYYLLIFGVFGISFAWILFPMLGDRSPAIALILSDLAMIWIVLAAACSITQVPKMDWLKGCISIPSVRQILRIFRPGNNR
jgi:O-antigen/teichoic acid export membrane protein